MAESKPAENGSDMIAEKPAAPIAKAAVGNVKLPEVPPGYKIVRVRKPDGTIVRVKRPIDPAAITASATAPAPAATSVPVAAVAPKETPKTLVTAVSNPAAIPSPTQEPALAKTAVTTAPTKTAVVPATSTEKTHQTKVTTAPVTAATTTKDTTVTHSPAQTSTSLANTFFQVAPKLGLLAKVARHGHQVAGAFIPDLDIGEWEAGDDEIDDGPDSDDEDWDDDGADQHDDDEDEKQDDDEDDRHNDNDDVLEGHSHTREETVYDEKHGTAGTGSAATSQLLKGIAHIPQQQNAANQQARAGPTVAMDKKGPAVESKEIKGEESPQPGLKPPRLLGKRIDWTRYVVWAIMIILPLLFILLGILVAVANGRPSNSALGQGVTQALKVGVSAWPIIFAAVVAQSLRAFATYRVERGIRLMTLEQLISSNSVASSFKQPFVLRRFDLVTFALFVLWGLSPLAGQALVRVSYIGNSTTTNPTSIAYVDTTYKNLAFGLLSHISGNNLDYMQTVNRLYSAAFLPKGVDQLDTSDVWDYPLVPTIEQFQSAPDSNGWYDVNARNTTIFSSVYGIPLIYWDSTNKSEYTFVIQSAYLNFECTAPKAMTMAVINVTGVSLQSSASKTLWMDMSNRLVQGQPGNLTFASLIQRNTTSSTPKRQATEESPTLYAYSECTYTQTFVDTELFCHGNLCSANRIRRTPGEHTVTAMGDMTAKFLTASGGGSDQAGLLTDTEQYILDPNSVDKQKTSYYDLSTLSKDVFTKRLSLLVNTFWLLGFAPPYQTGGLVFNPPSEANTYNPYGVSENVANGTRTDYYETYATSWGWLVALLFSSVIMLVAGVGSVIWDAQTIVPDILGFASNVARKSKYVTLPKMDITASGAERARELGHVRVMMQDVKPNADVGRVALGTAHKLAERLKPGRMYR